MKIKQTLLALAIGSTLVACGTTNTETTNATFEPLVCDAQLAEKSNDLRIYQVMVESFVDGNPNIGHGTGYGTSHHEGDIQGIIDSLDYIQSLGMNTVWLTPIFNSEPKFSQDHWADRLDATGYFASNYFQIDPRFGDMETARKLVDEAHDRGMYVLFDGVFGHHKSNIEASPTGLEPAGEDNPVNYPESLEFYKEVATYWIKELKIDGWRLDQAYQVPTEAWVEIRKAVEETSKSVTYTNANGEEANPLGYLVAEIWNNDNYIKDTGYGAEDNPALCSAFNFPLRYRLVETFAVSENNNGGRGGDWIHDGVTLQEKIYPSHAQPNLMLGNHDLVRIGDLLQRGNIADIEDAEYWSRHKALVSYLGAYTGPITLYYGEEIGDEVENFEARIENDCAIDGFCDDHVARSSAKIEGVTATLNANQSELKNYVAQVMNIRGTHKSLSHGERTNVLATAEVYVDHKQGQDEQTLYMVSTQASNNSIEMTIEESGSKEELIDLMTNESFVPAQGKYSIPLEGFGARYLNIVSPTVSGPIVAAAAVASGTGEGFMAQCDNPDAEEKGPISKSLYVVGDFSDSNWKHKKQRKFSYKGNNVYQAVVEEQVGSYRMQYAARTWSPQYTADGLSLNLGEEGTLKSGGYGKDTAVNILEAGKYVWSLKFTDDGQPQSVMASKCP